MFFNNAINWRVTAAIVSIYKLLTNRHKLHAPEHVGAFAGSYLQHEDWNHRQ